MVEHNLETLQNEKHLCKKTGGIFLDEEERSIADEKSYEEDSVVEEEETQGDGHTTPVQTKLGLDINMFAARKETLGKTTSQTKEMYSPRNESMERADLTMEDWIQETCLISAVRSGPTEPKTFQEASHDPVESERDSWRVAIRKKIRSMMERGVWRKQTERGYPVTEDLLEISGCLRSKEIAPTGQD